MWCPSPKRAGRRIWSITDLSARECHEAYHLAPSNSMYCSTRWLGPASVGLCLTSLISMTRHDNGLWKGCVCCLLWLQPGIQWCFTQPSPGGNVYTGCLDEISGRMSLWKGWLGIEMGCVNTALREIVQWWTCIVRLLVRLNSLSKWFCDSPDCLIHSTVCLRWWRRK